MSDKQWENYAKKHLAGRKIILARYMSKKEAKQFGWDYRGVVIQLDDGTLLTPSMDDEGNNAGALFGFTKKGDDLTFPVLR